MMGSWTEPNRTRRSLRQAGRTYVTTGAYARSCWMRRTYGSGRISADKSRLPTVTRRSKLPSHRRGDRLASGPGFGYIAATTNRPASYAQVDSPWARPFLSRVRSVSVLFRPRSGEGRKIARQRPPLTGVSHVRGCSAGCRQVDASHDREHLDLRGVTRSSAW